MEDSSLVIDGLLDSGWPHSLLRKSVKCLVDSFFSEKDKAFHTVFNGRSNYWLGPSLEANAFAVYLIDALEYSELNSFRNNALAYLLKQPFSSLGWKGRWFQQHSITNYYVLRALHSAKAKDINLIPILIQLLQGQSIDGSWDASILNTSLNSLCVSLLAELIPSGFKASLLPLNPYTATENARKWLATDAGQTKQNDPILYYWYDKVEPNSTFNQKYFYHVEDIGEIGLGWRTFAMSENGHKGTSNN